MEKTINLVIRDFKRDLKAFIESQQLPAAIVALVVKDINTEIQEVYEDILSIEEKQYNDNLKQKEDNNNDVDMVSE